jgi:type I restriction enzyme S subunit
LAVIARSKPEQGDTLFSNIGSVGDTAFVDTDVEFSIKNVALFKPDRGRLEPRYLYYLLRSDQVRGEMLAAKSGSAQPFISLGNLRRHEVLFHPSLETQLRIASILGAYDDLIEVNRRRVAILEDMARGLFEEWFVHFRFPGHEGLQRTDTTDGRLPDGWRFHRLGELGEVITGKTPSKAVPEYFGCDVPFLKIPDMHGSMFIHETGEMLSAEGAASQSNKTVPEGSICVSCIGTIGLVAITTTPCQTNQQINTIVPRSAEWLEFLYFSLALLKSRLINLGSNGATMGNVNKQKFSGITIACPPPGLLDEFSQKTDAMLSLIRIAELANLRLRISRDLLLPRLISGKISVEAAEHELEDAA